VSVERIETLITMHSLSSGKPSTTIDCLEKYRSPVRAKYRLEAIEVVAWILCPEGPASAEQLSVSVRKRSEHQPILRYAASRMAFLTGRRKNLGGLLWPPKALPVSVFSVSTETIGAPTLFGEPKLFSPTETPKAVSAKGAG
jgi:hypothetical protein